MSIQDNNNIDVISLFNNTITCKIAFESVDINDNLIRYTDIDKYATYTYSAIFGNPEENNNI